VLSATSKDQNILYKSVQDVETPIKKLGDPTSLEKTDSLRLEGIRLKLVDIFLSPTSNYRPMDAAVQDCFGQVGTHPGKSKLISADSDPLEISRDSRPIQSALPITDSHNEVLEPNDSTFGQASDPETAASDQDSDDDDDWRDIVNRRKQPCLDYIANHPDRINEGQYVTAIDGDPRVEVYDTYEQAAKNTATRAQGRPWFCVQHWKVAVRERKAMHREWTFDEALQCVI